MIHKQTTNIHLPTWRLRYFFFLVWSGCDYHVFKMQWWIKGGVSNFFDWKLNNMRHFGWYNSLRLSLNISKTASLFEFAIFIHNLPTLHHLRVFNLQCKNLHPSGVHWCTSIQAESSTGCPLSPALPSQ